MRRTEGTFGSKIFRLIALLIILLILFVAIALALLTMTEFNPKEEETVLVRGEGSYSIRSSDEIRIVTWNIGYGGLGEEEDFFMDGGKGVNPKSEEEVKANIDEIIMSIQSMRADILLLQEVDINSSRSFHMDQTKMITNAFPNYASTFSYNHKVPYIPYPWPPMGKVGAGLLTVSGYPIKSSTRIQLPSPFSWPIRVVNLKRCVTVHRMELGWTDKELVVMNLHLEAYDDGEGKRNQTKALMALLDEEMAKGNYVIAGGDFNQVFSNVDWSDYLAQKDKWQPEEIEVSDFNRAWQFVMDPEVPTCRSLSQPLKGANKTTFQYYMLDGFVLSSNITVIEAKTQDLGFVNTDHNPVVLRIKLK